MRKLSTLQINVFNVMVDFFKENDQIPPVHFVATTFNKYQNQRQEMYVGFEKRNMIERNAVGKFRFKRINEQ